MNDNLPSKPNYVDDPPLVFDYNDFERWDRPGHNNSGLSQKQINEIKKAIQERNIKNLHKEKNRMFTDRPHDKYYNNPTWDSVTNNRIKQLHPKIRADVKAFINECYEKGIKFRLTDGHRTFKEQDVIFNKGRSDFSDIVRTKAEAGMSYHNYGLAFDLLQFIDKTNYISFDRRVVIPIAIKYGFKWGGFFKGKDYDPPHFYRTYNFHWSVLKSKLIKEQTKYVNLTKK
ncbi:MAG: M15 family metallopeptidase [Bacteroidetes bacterium]|nr:M15 family metallopeptidase [Bacteroidota bacterium]